MRKTIDQFIFLILLPLILQTIVFYGYNSAYFPYHNLEKLPDYYYTSVYNYRFLSRDVLENFGAYLTTFFNQNNFQFKSYLLSKGTPFYHALFIITTFFMILSSISLSRILKLKTFDKLGENFKTIFHVLLLLLVAITQYVLTPYDASALFLFIITVCFSIKYIENKSFKNLLIITLLIIISTLNRETSSINLAFLGALLLTENWQKKENFISIVKDLSLPVIGFVATYLAVRIFLNNGAGKSLNEGFYLLQNLTKPNNVFGILFFLIFMKFAYLMSNTAENKKTITKFILLCSPYLIMIFCVGILWETRLFIPIILGSVFIALMNFEKEKLN